jgi:WD40 repeat protein
MKPESSKLKAALFATCAFAISSVGAPQTATPPAEAPRVDLYGDPLPPGAIARMGSVRWRATGGVTALAFSPDGDALITGGDENTVAIWDLDTGREIDRIGRADRWGGIEGGAHDFAFSPDGRLLAVARGGSGRDDISAEILDRIRGESITKMIANEHSRADHSNPNVFSVAFTADGGHLIGGGDDGSIRLWAVDSGREVLARRWVDISPVSVKTRIGWAPSAKTFTNIRHLALSPDGRTLAALGSDSRATSATLVLWPLGASDPSMVVAAHAANPGGVAFSRDGRRIYTAGGLENRRELYLAEDGQRMARYHRRAGVRVWDAANGELIEEYGSENSDEQAAGLALPDDGKTLAVLHAGGILRIWDLETGAQSAERRLALTRLGDASKIAISPDRRRLAAARWNAIALFDLSDEGPPIGENADTHAGGLSGAALDLAYAPDGKTLVSAGSEGAIRLWNAATGASTGLMGAMEEPSSISRMTLSADGSRAALVAARVARVWDVAGGRRVFRHESQWSLNRRLALSSDGLLLAAANTSHSRESEISALERGRTPSDESGIEIFDLESGDAVQTIGVTQFLDRLWFSPDDARLIGVDRGGGVRIWERASGALRFKFDVGDRSLGDFALTADGQHLASLGAEYEDVILRTATSLTITHQRVSENEIIFWNLQTGEAARRIPVDEDAGRALALTLDARRAVTSSIPMTHYSVWDLEIGRELKRIAAPSGFVSNSIAIAPDGETFAIGMSDGTILVYPMPPNP